MSSLIPGIPARRRLAQPLTVDSVRGQLGCTLPAEQQFLDALPIIRGVIRALGRRHRLSRDEQEEFASAVHARLIEADYALLRRFEGRSRLATYLRTVITRQFLDQRLKAWGRWRPSAEAMRLGPTAVALERLLEQQRLPLEAAIDTLCARETSLDARTLRDLASRLPRRVSGRRMVDDTVLERVAAPDPAPDELLEDAQAAALSATIASALRDVTATLSPREQRLLRLRYRQGTTVADISRLLGQEQKPLYRQLERLLATLRRKLEARGVSADHVRQTQLRTLACSGPCLSDAPR